MGGIQGVKRMVIDKLLDFVKEVGEEGLQRIVTDASIELGKQTEGLSEKGLLEISKDLAAGMGEEMKEAGPAMFVLSALGLGGGMIQKSADKAGSDAGQDIMAEPTPQKEPLGGTVELKERTTEVGQLPTKTQKTVVVDETTQQADEQETEELAKELGLDTPELTTDEEIDALLEAEEAEDVSRETVEEPVADQEVTDDETGVEPSESNKILDVDEDAQTPQEGASKLAQKAEELKSAGFDVASLQKKYNSKEATVTVDKIKSELRAQPKYEGATGKSFREQRKPPL